MPALCPRPGTHSRTSFPSSVERPDRLSQPLGAGCTIGAAPVRRSGGPEPLLYSVVYSVMRFH